MAGIQALRRYRESNDLSLETLAGTLGVSKATLSRWETGKRKPDQALLPKIFKKTGIAPAELRPDLVNFADFMRKEAAE